MLQLAAYISAARQTDPGRQVGTPLEVEFDRGKYLSQGEIHDAARRRRGSVSRRSRAAEERSRLRADSKDAASKDARGQDADAKKSAASIRAGAAANRLARRSEGAIWHAALPVDTAQSGFYEAQLN